MPTYQNNIQICQTVRENVRYWNSSRYLNKIASYYDNSKLKVEATELKAQEEVTRLPEQTFIPAALSRCNYMKQKYEKYTTHILKDWRKAKQIQKIWNNIPYTRRNGQIKNWIIQNEGQTNAKMRKYANIR